MGFKKVVTNQYFILSIGVLMLVALILVLGAWLQWSLIVQLVAVIGVLVVCILVLVIGFVRANRSASLIEQSIKSQAAQQMMNTRPDKRPEIEELQKQLETAIDRLKKSKLGQGRRGSAALYALPWYMFIGPPGAGKTTAIANSGLNFPLGTDRIRGVGGTRNCDWFFTDSAILLDTAGRYVTEPEDEEEWEAFLDTLKKHRSSRPVNGVIVGISIEELAGASPDEIEQHARSIRGRVDELVRRLGVRFPVYLLFTKCDLLQGFVELFGEMARKEREQIWGCTLDREQQASNDVRSVFDQEFRRLYDALLGMRSMRLSQSMKREDRQKVHVFPLEFAAVKDNLGYFIERLFQPNPYQESPVFRGFYFTSGTQEGTPIDRVIQAIARQFDLAPSMSAGYTPEVEAKSYFIKELFTDVIIPDQYMVRQTSKVASKGRFMQAGAAAAALVLLVLFVLAASPALLRSKQNLGRVQEAALAVAPVRWENAASAANDFARMDGFRDLLTKMEEGPGFLSWGLDRRGTVLDPARRLYADRARAFVAAHPLGAMEDRMQAGARLGRAEGAERDSLYNDLRAYLLMTSEAERLNESEGNVYFLERYLASQSAAAILPQTSAGERDELRSQIERQASAFTTGLAQGTVMPFEIETSLVERMRTLIYEPPSVARVYTRLKEEGMATLQPFTLADALRGRSLEMFAGRPEVPGFFTKRGWDTYVEKAFADETKSPDRADWVMGYAEQDLPESMQNEDQLLEQLREMYFNEYAANWDRFLRSVRVAPFGDIRTASRSLGELGNPYDSPLLYVLAQVTFQTQFGGGLVEDLSGRLGDVAARRADRAARARLGEDASIDIEDEEPAVHPVDLRFRRLHEMNADKAQSGAASPALTRALDALVQIGGTMDGLAGDPAKAADFAARVLSANGDELASQVQSIQSALSPLDAETRKSLFVDPVYYAFETVLGATRQHLNDRWRTDVYDPFREKLAGRYPLDVNAGPDVPLGDFELFFAPQTGTITTFFNDVLSPYLARDRRSAQSWEGRGIRISPEVLASLEHANRIGEGLFSGGVARLDFELQPEQPLRSPEAPAVSQVEIEVHGRGEAYTMGSYRPWTQVVWPGRSGAGLRISTQQGPDVKEFNGDWAWFRLLQEATVQRQSSTEYLLLWPFDNGVTVQYNLRTRSGSNPFNDLNSFFNFSCPESLI